MTHTANWHGKVLAKSDNTLEVGGYRYFPRDTVRMDLLKIAPKTASDLECPHGVQFYDVVIDGKRYWRNAWIYERPRPEMKAVADRVGFWEDVKVG